MVGRSGLPRKHGKLLFEAYGNPRTTTAGVAKPPIGFIAKSLSCGRMDVAGVRRGKADTPGFDRWKSSSEQHATRSSPPLVRASCFSWRWLIAQPCQPTIHLCRRSGLSYRCPRPDPQMIHPSCRTISYCHFVRPDLLMSYRPLFPQQGSLTFIPPP